MTKARTQHTAESPARKKTLTAAERCKAYRENIAQDPILLKKMRDDDKARAKRNRQKLKTPEQIQHERQLQRLRQKRYEERKKQKAAEQANTAPSRPLTRLDKEKIARKREANRLAVKKHRDNQTAQKRQRINEKRMARYYNQKETLQAAEQARLEKATEARIEFQSSGCPYPNKESFQRAVRRVREKINAKGKKFACLYKGLSESADKGTKQALREVGINIQTPQTPTVALQTHMETIRGKRDKKTLRHKRCLAKAFKDCGEETGISRRFVAATQGIDTSPYSKKNSNKVQKDIRDFFEKNAADNPCKASKKKQLNPVRQLHKEFVEATKMKVSLRSFHRHKPKTILSVKKLKFRQCLCEICLNPKLKSRLNCLLAQKCERIVE